MAVKAETRDNLKLPTGVLGKVRAQNEIQQQHRPHDIRRSIPLVDYTDPAKFPPYVFREYPKMPLLDGNRPIQIDDTGLILMFYTSDDETEFMDLNPELAEEIERNTPAKQISDRIAAKDDEISELRRKLLAAGIDPDNKRAKPPAGLMGAVRNGSHPKPSDDDDSDKPPTDDMPSGENSELRRQVQHASQPRHNPLKK